MKGQIMKVCVTSFGPTLDSRVQPIFGRCAYFIFVDPASMAFEAELNPNAASSEDAGILSAKLMVDRGVSAVLTGRVGTKAEAALKAAHIEVIPVDEGTVREVLEAFRDRG